MRFRLKSGAAITYTVRGAGEIIALLHPIGLQAAFWDPVAANLSTGYRVIAIDLRGHGDSDVTTEPYTLDAISDDCAELLQATAGPCIIAGCSMGSAVAQSMAVRHPHLVKAAVFANGSGPRTGGRTDVLEQRAARAAIGMPEILVETLDRWFAKAYAARHPETVALVANWLLEADPIVHSWAWRALAGRTDAYARIGMPVLVVAGSEDASASPASVKALADALPNARYFEIPAAGHLAPLEQPEAFATAVRSFLKENNL